MSAESDGNQDRMEKSRRQADLKMGYTAPRLVDGLGGASIEVRPPFPVESVLSVGKLENKRRCAVWDKDNGRISDRFRRIGGKTGRRSRKALAS